MEPSKRLELRPLVQRLAAFQETVRTTNQVPTPPLAQRPLSVREANIVRRLRNITPELAASFQQVLNDMDDTARATYVGPVGEAREVFRAAVHALAPDAEVVSRPWYKGNNGNPTQAERARYAAEQRTGKNADEAADAADVFEAKLGRLYRSVYGTASKGLHTSTHRAEAERIIGYVLVVLDDILPE